LPLTLLEAGGATMPIGPYYQRYKFSLQKIQLVDYHKSGATSWAQLSKHHKPRIQHSDAYGRYPTIFNI